MTTGFSGPATMARQGTAVAAPRSRTAPVMARFGAALALLGLVAASADAQAQGRPATVLVERIEITEFADTTPVIAELVATVEAEVASRTAGIVAEVLFSVGDRVEAGQPLVRLDSNLTQIRRRTATANLEAARAGIAVSEARSRLAAQALERQSQLRGSTAFSKGQFEDLEANLAIAASEMSRAQAQYAEAEAALAGADYDLRHATIEAPFGGVVVARDAQPGAWLGTGTAVATLLDVSAMEIESNTPVALVPSLTPGTRVRAVFDNGVETMAEVRSVLPVETVSTRTRPVRLVTDFARLEGVALAAGESVVLEVPTSAPRRAITVSKDALVQARGGWTVFAVEDGKASPREVVLGKPNGARMEVVSGLLPGEIVVVRGNERLRPGQEVNTRPVNPSAENPAETADATATKG